MTRRRHRQRQMTSLPVPLDRFCLLECDGTEDASRWLDDCVDAIKIQFMMPVDSGSASAVATVLSNIAFVRRSRDIHVCYTQVNVAFGCPTELACLYQHVAEKVICRRCLKHHQMNLNKDPPGARQRCASHHGTGSSVIIRPCRIIRLPKVPRFFPQGTREKASVILQDTLTTW